MAGRRFRATKSRPTNRGAVAPVKIFPLAGSLATSTASRKSNRGFRVTPVAKIGNQPDARLAVAPAPRLARFVLAILLGLGRPSGRCVVMPPADRTPIPENSRPHLVGRDRELRDLRRLLDAAMDGRGQLVLLGGEAGVGKTTIANALCREAAGRGALALVGHCYDLTDTPPYGPWMDAFDDYRPEADLPTPPAALARTGAGEITTRSVLFDGARHFVARVCKRRPLVMLLEDLHWADPESLDLLRAVSREAASQPLLVLATFRGDELAPAHPLYRLLPVLEREAGARRLELRRLHPEALHDLVAHYRLTKANSARLVTHLYAEAGGNPFFTQQLLRAIEEDEVLRPLGKRWVLGDLVH